MVNTNYFGGGVQNVERPAQYYEIIDQKKEIASTSQVPATEFAKILNQKNISIKDKQLNSNTTNINNMSQPSGTDIARIRGVAKQLTNQLYGFLWTQMAEGVNKNPAGGFGEEIFQKSLWPELVNSGSDGTLDELGEAIVRDLVKQNEHNAKQSK